MNPIYPEKRIHTKSFRYVETERLHARLEYLREHIPTLHRECEQKNDLRTIALEVINVERELRYRGAEFVPVTDGKHLDAVPVTPHARTMRPGTRERPKEWMPRPEA